VVRAEARLDAAPGRLDSGPARKGLALFRELSHTGPSEVLLFTDLHAGNVLSSAARGCSSTPNRTSATCPRSTASLAELPKALPRRTSFAALSRSWPGRSTSA
jgi:hypothetical protein